MPIRDLVYEMSDDKPDDEKIIVTGDAMEINEAMAAISYTIVCYRDPPVLPCWKWWSWEHIKADWGRYRRAVEAKRRQKHWDYVSERSLRRRSR